MALSGATIVGGAAVLIGADLSELIAAEAQAKAITTRIGQMKASVGMGGAGGGMGAGAQWMTNIMPTGTGAVALGGGSGTAMAGPGMSALDATFRRLAASGTAASAAIDRMALAADNAANALGGVTGTGGGGSGGSGGSGGGGGSGRGTGRGRRTPNLFSTRGIASALGIGVTGVFAAMEVLKIGTAFAHVADTEAHPERTKDAMSMGSKYGIEGNSVLSGVASQTDALSNSKTIREAFEGVPLVGTLVKFKHAVDGSTAAMEEQGKKLQRIAQLNEKSIAMRDSAAVAHAEEHGAEGAGKIQSLVQEWEAENAHVRESVKTGNQEQIEVAVEARRAAHDNIRDQVTKIKAQRLARTGDGTEENPGTEKILGDASRHRIWSVEEQAKIAHLKAIGADPSDIYDAHKRQIMDSQQAAREESGAAYDEKFAVANSLEKEKMRVRHRREVAVNRAKDQAELSELEDRRLEEKNTAEREAGVATAGAGAAALRQGGRSYQADELIRHARFAAELETVTDPSLKAAKSAEFEAGVKERRQIEGRRKQDVLERYSMSIQDAKWTMEGGEQSHKIAASHTVSEISKDIRDAQAGAERTAAKQAGLSRLDLEMYKLNAVGGGAFGITTKRNMVVGDPLDLSGEARDRREAEKTLADKRRKLQSDADLPGGGIQQHLPKDQNWWDLALKALQTIADNPGGAVAS